MATWDKAYLLAALKLLVGRDKLSSDSSMASADYYQFLTEAQAHYYDIYAAQVPYILMGAPTAMATTDSGLTYQFASSVVPLAVEIYDANYRLMKNGPFWDPSSDYVWEGSQIRFPKAVARQGTYYARYITPPGVIDAATDPTLVPSHTRRILIYRAAAEWAARGGLRDPAPFYDLERRAWMGDPNIGDLGILGALKSQMPWMGAAALRGNGGILDGLDTGAGYVRVVGGGG